jgi:hypothetical protein
MSENNFIDAEGTLRSLDLISNTVYTALVDKNIKPQIVAIYNKLLSEIGYIKEVWYGDADVYVSIEEGYTKYNETYDVLIIRNVVTCFDKNVIVAVINRDSRHVSICKCVHSSGKKNSYSFDDHRDWDEEGLDTQRNHEWSFGYNDLRDETLVFERSAFWEDVDLNEEDGFKKGYNDWHSASCGCGFHRENILYTEREVSYAYESICKIKGYVVEEKTL